jgi:hypothetical protein
MGSISRRRPDESGAYDTGPENQTRSVHNTLHVDVPGLELRRRVPDTVLDIAPEIAGRAPKYTQLGSSGVGSCTSL